jgi:NADH-quinone oxidoreductase subunit M
MPQGHVAHSLSAAANDEHQDGHGDDLHDVSPIEWLAWTPFLVAIVVFGVYPQLMFKVMDPAVSRLVETIEAGIPR